MKKMSLLQRTELEINRFKTLTQVKTLMTIINNLAKEWTDHLNQLEKIFIEQSPMAHIVVNNCKVIRFLDPFKGFVFSRIALKAVLLKPLPLPKWEVSKNSITHSFRGLIHYGNRSSIDSLKTDLKNKKIFFECDVGPRSHDQPCQRLLIQATPVNMYPFYFVQKTASLSTTYEVG